MERRIDLSNLDLDEAVPQIEARRGPWEASGLHMRSITWVDNDMDWPRLLLDERSDVRRPMSLGLQVYRDDGSEGELVIYAGGWADISVWRRTDQEPELAIVELKTVEDVGPLLDRFLARLVETE